MTKLANKLYFKGLEIKNKAVELWNNQRGDTNIIAIILILAIVIALAVVFRTQLTALFNKIWNSLFDEVDDVL